MQTEQETQGFFSSPKVRGCALGCLAVAVLGILASVGLYFWAATPGPQVPSDRFVGSETVGIAHLQGLQEDPAVQAMVRQILQEMQALHQETLDRTEAPQLLKWLGGMQRRSDDRDVRKALRDAPHDLTVNLELVPGLDEPQWIVIGNLSRFPRAIRLAYQFASFMQDSETVRGVRILQLSHEDPSWAAFIEDTLLFSENQAAIRQVIERGIVSEQLQPSSAAVAALATRQERWNIFGSLENRGDSFAWVLRRLAEKWPKTPTAEQLGALLDRVVRIDFGLDAVDEDTLEGFVDLICHTPEQATELGSTIDAFLQISGQDPHFEVTCSWDGDTVHLVLNVRQVSKFVASTLRQ